MCLKSHKGRVIAVTAHYEVATLLGSGSERVYKDENVSSQINVFRDHDFAATSNDVDSSLGVQHRLVLVSNIVCHVICHHCSSQHIDQHDFPQSVCLLGVRVTAQTKTVSSVSINSPRNLLGRSGNDRLLRLGNHRNEERGSDSSSENEEEQVLCISTDDADSYDDE
jgi:hypothetical protein